MQKLHNTKMYHGFLGKKSQESRFFQAELPYDCSTICIRCRGLKDTESFAELQSKLILVCRRCCWGIKTPSKFIFNGYFNTVIPLFYFHPPPPTALPALEQTPLNYKQINK